MKVSKSLRFGNLLKRSFPKTMLIRRYKEYLKLENPNSGDQRLLRNAAIRTNGKALNAATSLAQNRWPAWELLDSDKGNQILPLNSTQVSQAIDALNRSGFWVAPNLIHTSYLDTFQESAIQEVKRIFDSVNDNEGRIEYLHSNSGYSDKEMVFLGSDWVLNQELTYLMTTSNDILNVVGGYLGVKPILNLPESWFSFPVKEINKGSAQNWHFDCDRIKWIKVFVYLTDVNHNTGPHSYVATSHRNWRVKSSDSRFTEEQVREKFDDEKFQVFTAKRGTVIFEDTRGLHKGTRLTEGHRLILQLEFSMDSFGYMHPVFNVSKRFDHYVEKFPHLFPASRYRTFG